MNTKNPAPIPGTLKDGEFTWHMDYDEYDNSYWSLAGPFSSDGESVDIWWRLKQRLHGNRVVWYADHDSELVDASAEDEWNNLTDATNYIQEQHKAIVEELHHDH